MYSLPSSPQTGVFPGSAGGRPHAPLERFQANTYPEGSNLQLLTAGQQFSPRNPKGLYSAVCFSLLLRHGPSGQDKVLGAPLRN